VRRGEKPARVWAHGALPAAAALAAKRGMEPVRELWVMARPLAEVPAVAPVDGIRIAPFRPGTDDEAWVEVNARAFAHHPEQGAMTVEDLRERMAEPWFDPEGFFLAWRGAKLAGFHWTKVHEHSAYGDGPVGEVYVLGLDPGEQGHGLGRTLTQVGLEHLHDRGLSDVILYVEADNAPAVAVYTKLGFTRRSADIMYRV
jgi:mycothiol synthase